MKFTLCAIGTRGDVAPFLALGQALIALDAQVVIAAPPEFASDAAEAGLDFRPIVPEYLSAFNRMADTMGSPLKLLPPCVVCCLPTRMMRSRRCWPSRKTLMRC